MHTRIKLITVVIVTIEQTTYIILEIAMDPLIDNLRTNLTTTANINNNQVLGPI